MNRRLAHCKFVVESGLYEFPTTEALEAFLKNPSFIFDFQTSNIDDKEGMLRVFGELPQPRFPTGKPVFIITSIAKSNVKKNTAIVSVAVPMDFLIKASLEEFQFWAESDKSAWKFTGRIMCIGEDGLLDSEREEYDFSSDQDD